jgi:hypothetical protein
MLQTNHGPFNGRSWEDLCQMVFKLKHSAEGYQQIQADPGDFGLEGYTIHSGYGFQCYCPEKHYEATRLYEKQRDKITDDLNKLKKYEKDIAARIGDAKISDWIFVSPVMEKNALLKHAKIKQEEVRAWNLTITKPNFVIQLRDADFYAKEIGQVRSMGGVALSFDTTIPMLELDGPHEEYEANILRKTRRRLEHKSSSSVQKATADLYSLTLDSFVKGDGYLRKIDDDAPMLFARLNKVIREFEYEVREAGITWNGTPEQLTSTLKEGLAKRVFDSLRPEMDETTAHKIARLMIARWLAICELDFT